MMSINCANYILTDTLPAELPIIFSNREFYNHLNSSDLIDKANLNNLKEPSIPVQFKVKKNSTDYRIISLINPISEIFIAKFIQSYSELLLVFFEQNSVFSIRHYNKVNDAYIKLKDEELNEIEAMIAPEEFDLKDYTTDKYIRSYFNIIRFPKITDFYKSYTLKDLEIKYRYMLKMDIENCFGNIYTHSVDWAFLGQKITAKKNINETNRLSFKLDKVMQYANYAETHGILVGPEFSRMFAEIILTRVDRNVYEILKNEGLYYKRDYEIYRFIDDMFIFTSSRDNLEKIEIVIKDCIKEYKLTINEKKQYIEEIPFMRRHLWVTRAKKIIADFEDGCKGIKNRDSKVFAFTCWDEIRELCVECEDQMQYIISYIYTALERVQNIYLQGLDKIYNDQSIDDDKGPSKIYDLQAKWIDLIAQCLALSFTHKNVVTFSRMCLKALKATKGDDKYIQDIIFKKCSSLLKYHEDLWTELQNIVVMLALLDKKLLSPDLLNELLEKDSGYLSVSTVTYYIRKRDPKKIYYGLVYDKINIIIDEELIICRNLFGFDYNASKYDGSKIKGWVYSDHFYLIHDMYSSGVLDANNLAKIDYIIGCCNSAATSSSESEIIKGFLNYIGNFDKPFMKWKSSEDELITDFFLEKKIKRLQYK